MKQTITSTRQVFTNPYNTVNINDLIKSQDYEGLTLSDCDMTLCDGYSRVGTAVVVIELDVPVDEINNAQVTVLREQINQVYAAAEGKVQELESKIQNLLAISYDVNTVEAA